AMRHQAIIAALLALLAGAGAPAQNKAKPPTEDDYYKLLRFQTPKGIVMEAGAIEALPYGKMAVGTRRGEIWLIENAYAPDPKDVKFTRFAHGLHEVLGLAYKVPADGKFVPTTSGVRSPGGVGFNAAGDVFYTDNQGPWNGACGLKHLVPGGFVGHPDSFRWYDEARKLNPDLGPTPQKPKS